MKQKPEILVVCHDAGGAEIISAYIKVSRGKYNFYCYLSGPAKNIFKKKHIFFKNLEGNNTLEKILLTHPNADFVIAGLSWSSPPELNFIQLAKLKGIKTIIYLDHWTNYRERFGYPIKQWRKSLPDEVWVGDKHAKDLAARFFKGKIKIKLKLNLYFKEIKEEYKKLMAIVRPQADHKILFISEPMSAPINIFGSHYRLSYNEFDILNYVLSSLIKRDSKYSIIIRFHPSEKDNKYDSILANYHKKIKIVKSKNNNLLSDLAIVDLVIGMGSMALVSACLCGKRVISLMPNSGLRCPLPQKRIIKLESLSAFDRIKII